MDSWILNIKESKTSSGHKLQLPVIMQDCTVIPQLLWQPEYLETESWRNWNVMHHPVTLMQAAGVLKAFV